MFSRRLTLAGLSVSASLALAGEHAHAQKPKKPAAKPPAKPAAQAPSGKQPIVLGTKQLPGDFGEIGTTYTIGVDEPLNFTLLDAEYSVGRRISDPSGGDFYQVPNAESKLLILRFTAQNPNKQDTRFYVGSFAITGVSAKNTNRTELLRLTRPGEEDVVDFALKPAQKVEVMTALVVPAEGEIPKLIVQRGEGSAVVRYNLKGKIKPLAAPFADSTDKTGATAANPVQAARDTYYPFSFYDVKLTSIAYANENPDPEGEPAGENERLLVATFTFKGTRQKERLWAGAVESKVRAESGEDIEREGGFIRAERKAAFDGTLGNGLEASVRITYRVPKEVKPKTLYLSESEHRPLAFDISSVQ